jgi:hypothetical protein
MVEQDAPHVFRVLGVNVQLKLLQPGELHDGRQSLRATDPISLQAGELLQLPGIQGPGADVHADQRGHLLQDW